ncbi:MAG: hypothetical protein QOG23_2459 [Blastocatellia bacterium]|jgi:hypothetical protein|nr:hypothetical protein [Blastocatellia bacterium]
MLRKITNTKKSLTLRSISRLGWSLSLVMLTLGLLKTEAPAQDAQAILQRGKAYYDSNNTTDQAAIEFSVVIKKYRGSAEAESAQYYLASYYQRKFYIINRTKGIEDKNSLVKAKTEYAAYTRDYFKQGATWLSDAFFNLALVYFQMGDSQRAVWELNKMSQYASMDSQVYIYEVVWSPDSGDVIDGYYPAQQLAEFVKANSQRSFPDLVNATKRWLRASQLKKQQLK